ncbi:MAG: PAS domain-containing protein [Verrucomicrobia bacterium]|nr:PAS domain-containing protein [Verrucomicrobiota bacterium]
MPRPAGVSAGVDADLIVVGIGASTGGFDAITAFLENLPEQTGMAFVLVQDLDPSDESTSDAVGTLGSKTGMPVKEASDEGRVEANHVYVIPPGADMVIEDGILRLSPRTSFDGQPMPVDIFLRALAADRHDRAIAVILSGPGSDGALGVQTVKAEGGITFCQEPASAGNPGMPAAAISTSCVDFVLAPAGIAGELGRISRHPYSRKRPVKAPASEGAAEAKVGKAGAKKSAAGAGGDDRHGAEMLRVLILLRSIFGADFMHYPPTTIQRRVLRRMALLHIDRVEDYVRFLHGHEGELVTLHQEILLKVNSFFRDPGVFEFLKRRVFPGIVKDCLGDQGVRLWVPGCSTGEEAYSLAVCLSEYLEQHRAHCPVQIFATDLSDAALDHAREGTYIENIALDVSPERLRRFFTRIGRSYRVAKPIREQIVFARHNLVKDPPFSRLDLISCRHLLSDLSPNLRRKIGFTLHYALRPGGHLVLGHSENADEFAGLFTPLDEETCIFVRQDAPSRGRSESRATGHPSGPGRQAPSPKTPDPLPPYARSGGANPSRTVQEAGSPEIVQEANRLLIQRYAPPGAVVNSRFEVIEFHGQGHAYFEPAYGKASFNLLKLIKEPLAIHVRSLVAAARRNFIARTQRVTYREHGLTHELELEVVPLTAPSERHFLVLFHRATPGGPHAASSESERASLPAEERTPQTHEVETLRQELATTQQYLESIIKEQDAATEEIKIANEEIRSSNEELQSTNEELEAAKEELQTNNDELATLNQELQVRNAELANVNNDLINLVNSINFAILMLGSDGRIRRFTAIAMRLFNLIPADLGRPFSDIRSNLQVPDFAHLVDEVIQTVTSKEREVQDKEGRWYSMSIRPYRTSEHKIDGAVIYLVDIDDLKRSLEAFKRSRDFSQAVVETVREPLVVLDAGLKVKSANTAFYNLIGAAPQETLGRSFHTLADGDWDIPRLRRFLADVVETGNRIQDYVIEHNFREIGRKRLLFNGRRINGEDQTPPLILLAIEDVTERRRVEQQVLAVSERERRRMAQELHDGLGQHLTAITFVAQTIHHQLEHQNYAEATKNAEQLVTEVSEATGLTRDLAKGLHPMQLQGDQFQTAMGTLANNVSSLFKVVCTFRCDHPCLPPAGSDEGATQLYGIAQEAINNALKHAKPTRITISYKQDPQTGRARLLIGNDDSGSPKPAGPDQITRGMGLRIMRYRAESIGGKFHFDQAPDGSTLVTATFGEEGDEK